MNSSDSFDYIVVGAGSAGAAAASRLAESGNNSVLLLEAGEDDPWMWIRIPAGVFYLVRGERAVWRFSTETETHMKGRKIFWPRGRVWGGSSSVNGMIWVHGDPAEYDLWRDDFGLTEWSSEQVKPVFHAIENYVSGGHPQRGRQGPVTVTEFSPHHPLMNAFLDACESSGIPRTSDYNGPSYEGAGYLQFNTQRGLRWSTREAYLRPALRSGNLEIRSKAYAQRVLFDGKRAVGVEYWQDGVRHSVRCKREVILSAGALQSPQLLELSGIGDAARLQQYGIPVVHHLPAVGENLHDHLHTRVNFEVRNVSTLNNIMRSPFGKAMMAMRLMLRGNGLMSCSGQIIHALAKSRPEEPMPDMKLQLHWLSSPDARDPKEILLDDCPGISVGTFPLRPKSRGAVHIQSADVRTPPTMSANYLAHEDDQRVSVAALRMARKLAEQPALAPWIVREIKPGPGAVSDADLLDYVRGIGQTSYHPVGSCRMGTDSASVVDQHLCVRGVTGLRVADASVIPTMCTSNTNAPAIMIGERVADFIAKGKGVEMVVGAMASKESSHA